jgi:flagellar hook assembly protein FlgD
VVVAGLAGSMGADTVVSGTISASTTWSLAKSPFLVTGDVLVQGSQAPVLTIDAGVTVKFNAGTRLIVGQTAAGKLLAVGKPGKPIRFTANAVSPAGGYWHGIAFYGLAAPSSKIAYGTVEYGGFAGGVNNTFGGIFVVGSSPTLQNVTVQNSAVAGIVVTDGSPTVSGSTLTGNPIGFSVSYPATPSLDTTTISRNAGFAISMDAPVSFAALSGLTVSGNGADAIDVRTGAVEVNTAWRNGGIPYVLRGWLDVEGSARPVFTIEPGATLKFPPGGDLIVGRFAEGTLNAIGTATQRITFTANSASPGAGFWHSIRLYGKTTSTIAYATVSYGGQNDSTNGFRGAVHVESSSPVLDHVRFDTNAYAGVSTSLASPTIKNCDFTNNSAGLKNQTSGTPVSADLNWWNSASGPSGSGPGAGQLVSAGVRFEPWLTAAASAPQFVKALVLGNSTFNPSIGVSAAFSFSSAMSGSWKATFSSGGTVIRTITGSGDNVSLSWDGKDSGGTPQATGSYAYRLETASGTAATPVFGHVAIDLGRQLTISGVVLAPAFFSPNGDGAQETTTLTGAASFDGAAWTVVVKNAAGTTVRTVTGPADPSIVLAWDGKNASNIVQPDGPYTLNLTVTDGGQTVSATAMATLDRTPPSASIASPAVGAVLSNVHQNGNTDVDISGTGTDATFKNWLLEYGAGSSPATWTQIAAGTTAVSNARFGTWLTLGRANGTYLLRLQVFDQAGNMGVAAESLTIGNFTMTQSVDQFNPAGGGTVTYTSAVPFALTEAVSVKNLAGQTVRTLFSGARAAGVFSDVFNGRDAQGNLLPDGPYFYTATATAGTESIVWDLSARYTASNSPGFLCQAWLPPAPAFQPFNNRPLPLSYFLFSAGRVWLLFSPGGFDCNTPGPAISACSLPDSFCSPAGEYQEAGTHTGWWAGVDPAGLLRGNIGSIVLLRSDNAFSQNAVVLFGTKPALSNLAVAPPNYNPGLGPQAISLDVSSYQNQPVSVSIAYFNQESQSVLRTVTANGRSAGHVTINWDGHAENGMWVAPGAYTLTVTASDGIGNAVSRKLLTMISY